MDANKTCSANFTPSGGGSYTLSINPTPTNGTVTSSPAGINCGSGGSACSASFSGTVVLTATPDAGYTFAGWTGDCSNCSTGTTCNINMTADKTCSANFTASGGAGTTWTLRHFGNTLYGVVYGNNTFVALGSSGAIFTSPDGINWTQRNSGTSHALYGVTYGNGMFVVVGDDSIIFTSP